jgi:dTDP-4-dehydrorhamnose 3,5-epimerase
MLFIPKGCAHGYITLEDNCIVLYKMTEFYIPGNDGGYRYDDPSFGVEWPCDLRDIVISEKDKKLPLFRDDVLI